MQKHHTTSTDASGDHILIGANGTDHPTRRNPTKPDMITGTAAQIGGQSDETRPNPTEDDHMADGKLTARQQIAATLLAGGKGVQQVAGDLGVHRSTLSEWRALPAFTAYYSALLDEASRVAREGLLSSRTHAIATIHRLMDSENESVALKAAIYVLERSQL